MMKEKTVVAPMFPPLATVEVCFSLSLTHTHTPQPSILGVGDKS